MTPRYVLCALGLLVTACDLSEMLDHTEDARRLLGERDLTELDVHRATDNDLRYDFVGRREDMLCTGNLEFDEAMSTSAFSTHIACGASIRSRTSSRSARPATTARPARSRRSSCGTRRRPTSRA